MTLFKWVLDDIRKLTYIKKVETQKGNVLFFYEKDGKERYRRLPLRADKNQVLDMLTEIRMEIHYDANKVVIREKQTEPAFIIAGETYGK